MPEEPKNNKLRFFNVITTGNGLSFLAAVAAALPAIVFLWHLGQWPADIERKIDFLVQRSAKIESLLERHGSSIATINTEIAVLSGNVSDLKGKK